MMADRVESFETVTPAGTLPAAPVIHDLRINSGLVERLEILVPPGPSGLVGIQVTFSGEPIIPYRGASFLVADNEVIGWDLANYPDSGAWGARIYNNDIYEHRVYFRFLVNEMPRAAQAVSVIVPIAPGAEAEAEDETPAELAGAEAPPTEFELAEAAQ